MNQQQKKPSHLRRLLQIFSSKIHEGDVIIRNDKKHEAYIVKTIVGTTITVQDKKYKHVEIAMSTSNVKKSRLLSYIEYDSLEDDNV